MTPELAEREEEHSLDIPDGDHCLVSMPGVLANTVADLLTLVDEAKIRVSEEEMELSSVYVDPANVSMHEFTLSLDTDLGVTEVQTEGDVLEGVRLDWLRKRLRWTRKPEHYEDSIDLLLDSEMRKIKTLAEKDVIRESSNGTIDPDAIRQEPDIPSLDLPNQAVIQDLEQFYQGVQAIQSAGLEHCKLSGTESGDIILYSQGDTEDERIVIPDVAGHMDMGDPGASSLFSMDYLWDMAKALRGMERLTVTWGQEFPVKLHYQDSELGVEGQFMLAPRIQSD